MRRNVFGRLVAVSLVAMFGSLATTSAATAVDLSGPMPVLDAEEKAFVTLVNNYRIANGLQPLQVSITLTKASDWFSRDLGTRSIGCPEIATAADPLCFKLRHDDTLKREPQQRLDAYGYPASNTFIGENIAAGFPDAARTFEQFRTSPIHDVHMLDVRYTTMGIARVDIPNAHYDWYWTNVFAGINDPQVTEGTTPPPAPLIPGRSALVPLPPTRILDTRPTYNNVAAGGSIDLPVAGRGGVPTDVAQVAAVVMTVTITGADDAGFVTAYPNGAGRPDASNLNVEGPGKTVANLVSVPIGANGRVTLYSSGGGHLLADVVGYYRTVASTATSGRFQPTTPTRVVDTRPNSGLPTGGTKVVRVVGQAGVPATGVSAISVNLTVTGSKRAGFLTAYPALGGLPDVSNLNLNAAGDTVAGAAIVPVDANGDIAVYIDAGGDLLVDINGYFTDASAAASTHGIYMARTPSRELDTRGVSTLGAGCTRGLAVPAGAIAISGNLTLTGTGGPGFLSAYPGGGSLPNVSSLNTTRGSQTVANHALVPAATNGIRFFSSVMTDLIVDYDGYYLPSDVNGSTASVTPDGQTCPTPAAPTPAK